MHAPFSTDQQHRIDGAVREERQFACRLKTSVDLKFEEEQHYETALSHSGHCRWYTPYLFFTKFLINHGIDLPGFISALFANPPVAGFTADFLFSSFVFSILMFHETNHYKDPNPLIFVALNLVS